MEHAPFDSEISEGPAGAEAYWLWAEDGVKLRVALWRPEQTAPPHQGTIFFFPGRGECLEKYGRTAKNFADLGYTTLAIDWRGQGGSDRLTSDPMVGYVRRFSDYQRDVAALVTAAQALDLPKPWFLIGHSMGAGIGLRALIEGLPVAACAFTAPMWGIRLKPLERIAAWPLSAMAQSLGRGDAYVPGDKHELRTSYVLRVPFEENRLTGDADMFGYMVRIAETLPHLQTAAPSLGWLFQALKECRALAKRPSPDLPCLTFSTAEDELVDHAPIEARMAHWPGGRHERFATARHDLLSEQPQIRAAVIAQIHALFAAAGKDAS